MIIKIDRETIDFLCKHKLTFTQLGICLLIYHQDTAAVIKLQDNVRTIGSALLEQPNGKYKSELRDLIDRGFIEQISNSPNLSNPLAFDNFRLNKDFSKEFLVPSGTIVEELIDAYPKKLYVNGVEFPATSCDFDKLEAAYIKAIKGSLKKHGEILKKLTAYKERNSYAQVGIEKFVGGRLWETLEETIKSTSRGY